MADDLLETYLRQLLEAHGGLIQRSLKKLYVPWMSPKTGQIAQMITQ